MMMTKKSVAFSNTVTLQDASECHAFSEDQMDLLWWSRDELKATRKQLKKIIKKPAKLNFATDCWRGLEAFANRSKDARYSQHIQPVLEFTRSAAQRDDESIRCFSASLSARTTEEAVKLATNDFLEAYGIHRETMCSKTVDSCFATQKQKIKTHRPTASATAMPMARTA
ncbi:expressed unknown protein [Seminavis robusta]|uniref:Uncharacterized protein n=1 Tax=Seminavis robusta TaxID=568900 RepID=A0A9N8E4V5_9STRA|nr:expressed unknown protein [Seminavis robusta]|eukprot:Sro661_g183170.1 n/a (170) ;mRNA; r:24046-24555